MTPIARTLLSTDALPIAAVVLPRELTPDGAPPPADVEPPTRPAATARRLAYVLIGLAVAWPLIGFGLIPLLPPERVEQGVVAGLVLTGLVLFAFVAFDHDRVFARRRRAGWQRALRALGGDPTPAGARLTARITAAGRPFAVDLGVDDCGLECAWITPLPRPGEALAELSMQRRSTARRFWPTGDPDFDARVAVRGPLDARVALLAAADRAAWSRLIAEHDVTLTDGRLFFSLASGPRTARRAPIRRLVERLCADAARCVYPADSLRARLAALTEPGEPPAIAANALRTLRGTAPGSAITLETQARLLADPDPWRRVMAAEVAGDEDTLVALLAAAEPAVRFRAVDALIDLWPLDGLAERLDLLLDHPEGAIRGTALSALGGRSLPLAAHRLDAAAHDPDPRVGDGLLDWLHTATGPHARAALAALLRHPSPKVVHRAADRLGRVGGPDAEALLVELTRDRAHRRAARAALLQLRRRYPQSLGGVSIDKRGRRSIE